MDSIGLPSVPSWEREEITLQRSEFTHERDKVKPKSRSLPAEAKGSKRMKELNKRLKCIYEDEGAEYGSDTADEDTVIERFQVATRLRKQRIDNVMKDIRRARNVELCFLVDSTGSMQPHIDGVRRAIKQIVTSLTGTDKHVRFQDATAKEMKVAFVGYRDHDDSPQFEVLNFTASVPEFEKYCAEIQATGGGDTPEDVFGGLEQVLSLRWSDNAGTKVLFHICDAPCHGKEFHADLYDSYPDGDPKGRKHTDLFSRLRSIGIQYYFGKINSSTDVMLEKFAKAYGEEIVEFDVEKVDDIMKSVMEAVVLSISASVSSSMTAKGADRKERTVSLEKAEPVWPILPVQKGRFVSYKFPKSIKDIIDDTPLERKPPTSAEIKVAPNPFGKGAERIAFYGQDLSLFLENKEAVTYPKKKEAVTYPKKKEAVTYPKTKEAVTYPKKKEAVTPIFKRKAEHIVLKEYLHEGKGMNTAKRYELSNQMQTVAAYLATKFVEDIKNQTGLAKSIKFMKIRTLSISEPLRMMSAERRFSPMDRFIRFSNNTTYEIMEEKAVALGVSADFVQLVTAFSHWTHKATGGFLMVVDLEGVVGNIHSTGEKGVLLTDPAIHCKDITRYGPMNHGRDGMNNFFSRHKCNKYCNYLDLDSFRYV